MPRSFATVLGYFSLLGIACLAGTAFAAQAAKPDIALPLQSPNHLFEVYTAPEGTDQDVNGASYDYGTKLYLRAAGSRAPGALLRENSRWMQAQWCPHSGLLGVEDHWDGHASQVYVYEVALSADRHSIVYKLVFHSLDNAYDRQWFIEGWEPSQRIIHLRLEQRGHDDLDFEKNWPKGLVTRHASYVIGTTALVDDQKVQ